MGDSQITKDFTQKIIRWVRIDDDLKHLRETMKEMNDEKKQLDQYILEALKTLPGEEVGITDGKLVRQVSKKQEPLKKENITKALVDIVKDETKAAAMCDHILKSRAVTEKESLKRVRIKQ